MGQFGTFNGHVYPDENGSFVLRADAQAEIDRLTGERNEAEGKNILNKNALRLAQTERDEWKAKFEKMRADLIANDQHHCLRFAEETRHSSTVTEERDRALARVAEVEQAATESGFCTIEEFRCFLRGDDRCPGCGGESRHGGGECMTSDRFVPEATQIARLKERVAGMELELSAARGIKPHPLGQQILPPYRFGIRWGGPTEPLAVPMADGYWMPWHLAMACEAGSVVAERKRCLAWVIWLASNGSYDWNKHEMEEWPNGRMFRGIHTGEPAPKEG